MRRTRTWLLPVLAIVLTWGGVSVLGQNSSGGAFLTAYNYVIGGQWTWRGQASPFIFEGTTDNEFETTFTVTNPTADRTFTIPDATGGTFVFSSLATNGIDVANSIWGASNGLVFEGVTADGFETTVSPTDVGADITLTLPGLGNASGAVLASTLTTNDLGAANSVWGVSNGLTFEGSSADAGELFLTVANIATASRTMTLPDMGAASAVLATTLTTNTVGAANSVWGVSNGLTFEGSSADAGELFLTVANIATASRTMTLPDMGAASAVLASTLTTNAPDVANSIWGISNALAFGGATGADGFEIQLTPADVGADRVVTIPDMGAASALLATTLATNAPGVANSVWGVSAGLTFEGSDADTEELLLDTEDLTADVTVRFKNDVADTYFVLTMPDGDQTTGFWQIPEYGAADAELTMTDNTLYVYRVYLPTYLTIANMYLRASQGAQVAGVDDILGVAIYEDADAGAVLLTGSTADVTATGDFTINPTDATLGPGFYRVAVCSGDGDGAAFVGDTVDDEFIDVANLGAVTIGTGANACVAGVPPATTGALTTADINVPVLKFGA